MIILKNVKSDKNKKRKKVEKRDLR